jgi:hypothetical protein
MIAEKRQKKASSVIRSISPSGQPGSRIIQTGILVRLVERSRVLLPMRFYRQSHDSVPECKNALDLGFIQERGGTVRFGLKELFCHRTSPAIDRVSLLLMKGTFPLLDLSLVSAQNIFPYHNLKYPVQNLACVPIPAALRHRPDRTNAGRRRQQQKSSRSVYSGRPVGRQNPQQASQLMPML